MQRQRRFRDGTGMFQPQGAVVQLLLERRVLLFQLFFVLLERVDDLDQFGAAHPPQFTFRHVVYLPNG